MLHLCPYSQRLSPPPFWLPPRRIQMLLTGLHLFSCATLSWTIEIIERLTYLAFGTVFLTCNNIFTYNDSKELFKEQTGHENRLFISVSAPDHLLCKCELAGKIVITNYVFCQGRSTTHYSHAVPLSFLVVLSTDKWEMMIMIFAGFKSTNNHIGSLPSCFSSCLFVLAIQPKKVMLHCPKNKRWRWCIRWSLLGLGSFITSGIYLLSLE